MKERIVIIIKLLTSHILLVPLILTAIFLFNIPWVPALLIAEPNKYCLMILQQNGWLKSNNGFILGMI